MRRTQITSQIWELALLFAVGVLGAIFALLMVHSGADILQGAVNKENGANGAGKLDGFVGVVEQVKGPATVAMGSLVPLGMLVGGSMLATGNRKGMQFMVSSAGAGAAILLGNGIVK